MQSLLEDARERSLRYLQQDSRVSPTPEVVRQLDAFREELPAAGSSPDEVLAMLDDYGSPATVRATDGRYFGFVNGGILPASLAAHWLAGAWNQNAGLAIMSPVAAVLEEVVLGWVVDLLGLPATTGGGFVTGATMANFTSLAAARHAVLQQAGWDVENDGLIGAPPIQIVVGEEVHFALRKALGLLGLGRNRAEIVPADHQGRMRADSLPRITPPAIVCIQAGNVNSGAFDPAQEICERVRGAWVHVDGAFGLWAAASPSTRHLTRGFELADSWATDAHKWPNCGYDCGLALVRHPDHLLQVTTAQAPYLPLGSTRNPTHYTPESSRRARGVEVWAALRSLGRRGMAELVDRCCRHARRFAEGLSAAGYRILNDVVINQVLVSFGDAGTTNRVIAAIQEDGTCWCGGTVWQGHTAMRISVSDWATNDKDVERSLEAMIRCARQQ
jgi:glutamate/tyrosine decarboxylase-like PLP-dependent enzyme